MERTEDMSQGEMVEILKGIIRDGKNGAARIAAIKTLREIQKGEAPPVEGFAALDGPRLKAV